jgi:hypothetical protein
LRGLWPDMEARNGARAIGLVLDSRRFERRWSCRILLVTMLRAAVCFAHVSLTLSGEKDLLIWQVFRLEKSSFLTCSGITLDLDWYITIQRRTRFKNIILDEKWSACIYISV